MIFQIWARHILNCGLYAKNLSSVLLIFHLKRWIRFRNYPKINFPCKISRWIQSRRLNWPKYRRKAEKPKKCTFYWNIHYSKTDFLNLLKFWGKIVNYMFFKLAKLLKYHEFFWISFPSFIRVFLQFSGFALHGDPIMSSYLDFSSDFTSITVVCIILRFFSASLKLRKHRI